MEISVAVWTFRLWVDFSDEISAGKNLAFWKKFSRFF